MGDAVRSDAGHRWCAASGDRGGRAVAQIRNGVGARDAHTALFAISDAPVSFGRFARLFRDDLHCKNALFLDGVVSSAWIPEAGRRDTGHPLGPMLVVLDRR